MQPLRVAHIANAALFLRNFLLNQLLHLQHLGYEVSGMSPPSIDGTILRDLRAANVDYVPVPMTRTLTPWADLLTLWRLYRILRRQRFTIVHTHNPKPSLLGQLAARLAGVPIIVNTVHGFYFHERMPRFQRCFYLFMEKIAARCSDLILSQNQEDLKTAIQQGICSADKIQYLGNGIDLTLFDPDRYSSASLSALRHQLGIPAAAKVVGFVGRLAYRRKGFADFLKAGEQLIRDYPQVRFLVIGDRDEGKPDAVDVTALRNGPLWKHCHFLGRRPNSELPPLFRLMDVFVLPSIWEGLPRVVMEASAMGVPTVATDVKGNREAVHHGRTGLLVPLGDPGALAGAVLGLLTDGARARALGEEARRMALRHFDERVVFDKVAAAYRGLLERKGLAVPSLAG